MAQAHATDADKYYIPHGSPWPIFAAVSLFTLMSGAVALLNEWLPAWSLLPGVLMLAIMFFCWFGTVIDENQHGVYNLAVDRSFRMGMMWFIFSEVMFFAAFFGALFYARHLSAPWLAGHGTKPLNGVLLVEGLRGRMADERTGRARPAGRRHVRDHSGLRVCPRSTPRSCCRAA